MPSASTSSQFASSLGSLRAAGASLWRNVPALLTFVRHHDGQQAIAFDEGANNAATTDHAMRDVFVLH